LALQLVAQGVDPEAFAANPQDFDLPDSVIGFLDGELGDPPGGWPEPFRSKALAGRSIKRGITPISQDDRRELNGNSQERRNRLNHLLFPAPTKEFEQVEQQFGDISVIPTPQYLYGLDTRSEVEIRLDKGVRILVGLEAVGVPDNQGMRTVMFTLNGQLRPIQVRDRSVEVSATLNEKADPKVPGHVGAPYAGSVTLAVQEGQSVTAGQTIATIEAMKMEASITSPIDGTVTRLAIGAVQQLDGGDLIVVVD
jgi:pyruvate carboxylase